MRRNFWIGLIIILAIIGTTAYISLPSTNSFLKRPTKVQQGLDLQGGVRLVYQLDFSNTAASDRASAVDSTVKVIENRVNTLGVAEPLIQPAKVGLDQVVTVELPGIKDPASASKLIGETAQLDFREMSNNSTADPSGNASWLPTGLSGKQLSRASVSFDPNTNKPQVSLQFNGDGTKLFGDITGRNVGKQVAIFLDNNVISAPTVQQQITTGQAVITGDFTVQQVKDLVNLLNAGALDVPLKLVQQNTVGATLGVDSIKKSLIAGLAGILLVALFMLINYRAAGLVAILALSGYALITLAVFKIIPVTLTLSGIAGFILSIGMAVDANILIFERLREELRAGRELKLAMTEAFKRAWPSIRDSNASTLITCAILYFTTSGSIRGFALTLAIGVFVSLFSSITASRSFLRLFALNPFYSRLLEKV